MSGHIYLKVHYLLASTGSDIIPLTKHTCPFQHLQPHHITCGLHPSSVDAPEDVHSRSHNFPLIHPREVLLVGHLSFTSHGGGLAWGGACTPLPCMMDAYTQGNTSL